MIYGAHLPAVGEIWRRNIWRNSTDQYIERQILAVVTTGPHITVEYSSPPLPIRRQCSLGQWLQWIIHARQVTP